MWVIFKEVSGFYYYAQQVSKIEIRWVGITDIATKYPNKKMAEEKAEHYGFNPTQIKEI